MTYVALLRGINVGGNAKVEMARLKQLFIGLGCTNVTTYINSGNVIFADERTSDQLVPLFEAAILTEFSLTVPIVVRSQQDIRALCQQIPTNWNNDEDQKSDVYFLMPDIDNSNIITEITINPDLETVCYVNGAILWNVSRQNAGKSQAHNFIKTKLYRQMTIRNVNTVRQLDKLMQSN